MTTSGRTVEASNDSDPLSAFVSENETSSSPVAPLPKSGRLLEIVEVSLEDLHIPLNPQLDPQRQHRSAWSPSAADRMFTSAVALGHRCHAWLASKRSPVVAARERCDSIRRRVTLGLSVASATLNVVVKRGALLAAFGYGVAARVVVALLLRVQSALGRQHQAWRSARRSLTVAVRQSRNSLHRRLVAGLRVAGPTLNVVTTRWSSRVASGCAAALRVSVALFLQMRSAPGRWYRVSLDARPSRSVAVRESRQSIHRRLKLELHIAGATLKGAMKRRPSLVAFGCGVAVGVLAVLFLLVQSESDAAFPSSRSAPSEPVSRTPQEAMSPAVSVVPARLEQVAVAATGGRRATDARPLTASRAPAAAQRAASPKFAGYRGSLEVNSVPAGARVFVNNLPAGVTPLLLQNVPVGARVVRLELDGYQRWSSAVSVVANQRLLTKATLRPSPEP
jgi:hypothetical protein